METRNTVRQIVPAQSDMYGAVDRRDAAWDGRFWYGVVTTGVYCRPSCPARTPRTDNVRYFFDPADARRAGFRACRRCRPDDSAGELERIVALARHIEANAEDRLPLQRLAGRVGLSPSRLQKKFKAVFGMSPRQFQDAARLGRFKTALREGGDVTDAIFAAGYGSVSRVYGEATRNIGMTPSAYRSGGRGETIYHACRDSALGPLLMAATESGVCFAQFGDDEDALLARLRAEFPHAECVRSDARQGPALDAWIEALDAHLKREAPRPDLPLDLRGTSFQLKIWRFLLSVREGDVVSYGEVARGIGKPSAVRAAASACGANRVGVLVPCHRVLCGNGDLGGYRWGTERKRTLIDGERRQHGAP